VHTGGFILITLAGLGACGAQPFRLPEPAVPRVESGEAVVVVFNRAMPESFDVAAYYARQRSVPTNNLIGLDLPTSETMTRQEFREKLRRPLSAELERRGLWAFKTEIKVAEEGKPGQVFHTVERARIRYAVLCYGVPLKILGDASVLEPLPPEARPEMRRNEASVDNELALLPHDEKRFPLSGPLKNPLYGVSNAAALHPANGILLVTRLDGPTPEVARGLVDKALIGERDGLWGRAYFDLRSITDGSYKLGDDWIRAAAQVARRAGYETVVDERAETFGPAFPLSQVALYAGWYDGQASGPFARDQIEFMPGAVAYHLHSYNAPRLRTTDKTWVPWLLARGVTATLGSVDEPYLIGTPDLGVFFARLILGGFSLGEAGYAAQMWLSWQTIVVGDPLYRPFARSASLQHEDLARRGSRLIEWSHLRVVNLNLITGASDQEMIGYLEREPLTRISAVLLEKLGDLHLAGTNHAAAAEAYGRALNLPVSQWQKTRLTFQFARACMAGGRALDAYQALERFRAEHPGYPDQPALIERMMDAAAKAKKTAEAEKLQIELLRMTRAPGQ
jgi:uncharacterized protein (TIGR03790 family)